MRVVLFGPGYTGSRIAAALAAGGAEVAAVTRATPADAVRAALARATHLLSTVAPEGGADRVLAAFGREIARVPWAGYLSSTGVYGDWAGAWVDEGAPLRGRRGERIAAEAGWLALGARAFRLPGIYGPGRSPLDRAAAGTAHRLGRPDHMFSRIHVDDIAAGVMLGLERAPPGPINLADDLPASPDRVAEEAARLLGLPPPPFAALESLSPMARGFWADHRRVANGRARRLLGWRPLYPDYRAGLRGLMATSRPAIASAPPAAASADQR